MMHRFARILLLLGMAAAIVSLSACAAAEKPRFARHGSTVVTPRPAGDDTLILAFGLDRLEEEPALLAAVSTAEAGTH